MVMRNEINIARNSLGGKKVIVSSLTKVSGLFEWPFVMPDKTDPFVMANTS